MILSREKILESKSSISIEIDEPTLKKCFAFLKKLELTEDKEILIKKFLNKNNNAVDCHVKSIAFNKLGNVEISNLFKNKAIELGYSI